MTKTMRRFKTVRLILGMISMLMCFSLAPSTASAATAQEAKNKKLVLAFYDLTYNKHKPRDASKTYLSSRYVEHCPESEDGVDGFVTHKEAAFAEFPESHVEIKQVVAEDDLVMLHVHAKERLQDRGKARVDIFRVKNGKISEHWNVVQPVAESPKNPHTMF